jgi:hypothetical protein
MPIKEEYMFSKFFKPQKENKSTVLTIGIPKEDLQKFEIGQQYIIKFYKLEIEG